MLCFHSTILPFNSNIRVLGILDASEFGGEERIPSVCCDSSQHYNHEIRLCAISHLQLLNVAVESLPVECCLRL